MPITGTIYLNSSHIYYMYTLIGMEDYHLSRLQINALKGLHQMPSGSSTNLVTFSGEESTDQMKSPAKAVALVHFAGGG